MEGGGAQAVKPVRAAGLLPDADWDELEHLGVVDVLFVATPNSELVSAVVLLRDGCGHVQSWALAERGSIDAAREAVQFFLRGLAELRRRTRQVHPWARAADDGAHGEGRIQSLNRAIEDWRRRTAALTGSPAPPGHDRTAAFAGERARRAVLGAPIVEARKRRRVTQAGLAQRTGIKVAVLSQIERGLRAATVAQRARIGEALDVDPDDLI